MKEKRKFKFNNYKANYDKRTIHGNNHHPSKSENNNEEEDGDDNKEGNEGEDNEISKGSIPLEEVKAHPEYPNRVEFAGMYLLLFVILG